MYAIPYVLRKPFLTICTNTSKDNAKKLLAATSKDVYLVQMVSKIGSQITTVTSFHV